MSTDTIRQFVDGDSPLVSWETWDRIKHTEWFVFVGATTFVALFSLVFRNVPYLGGYHGLARTMLAWMIFALAFNLLLGQTGLLSFGHAMFWGGAGYAAVLFSAHVHGDPLLMIAVGTLFAVVLAVASAFVLLRLHTVYFAIMTLAIAQMLYYLVREPLEPWTNGINGLSAPPEPLLGVVSLRDRLPSVLEVLWVDYMYVFMALVFVGVVVFVTRVRKSPYGLIFKAIRENERRAAFVGLDVWRYKFAAFLLSATIAGIAGALYAVETDGFAGVSRLYWETSGDIVVIVVLGGLGTVVGPILGAIVYRYFAGVVNTWDYTIPFLEFLGGIGRYWLLLLAIAFTAVVWTYPSGLWGMITSFTAGLRDPRQLAERIKRAPGRAVRRLTRRGGDR